MLARASGSRRSALLATALVCTAAAAGAQATDSPRTLRDAERDIARSERAELREDGTRDYGPPDREWLVRARALAETQLRANPDDVNGLVLLGRIGRFVLSASRAALCGPETGCVLDTAFDDRPFHAALDRALALRPDAAAAHFWKARLIADGRPVIRDRAFHLDVDTAALLAHAARAIALEPGNVRYRVFLAETHAEAGRYAEAAAVVRPIDRGRHPLYVILQDFAAFPVPEGAVAWPGHALYAAVGLDENPPRFAAHTGRSWAVPMDREAVAAFYRRVWPELRFFEFARENAAPLWLQQFRSDATGKLQPTRDSTRLVFPEGREQFRGLMVLVRPAGRGVDPQGSDYPAAVAGVDVFTEIIILNGRHSP
jgi:hypothetical protein